MADFNPSKCEIIRAEITPFVTKGKKPVDISLMIGSLSIQQSINSVAISGTIDVLDSVGLIEDVPLRGEESLELELKSLDTNTSITIRAQIYKISDVSSSVSTKQLTYTLHWITKTSFNASKRRLIKAFRDKKASNIVKEIFEESFAKISPSTTSKTDPTSLPDKTLQFNINNDARRKLYIQETEDNMRVIIPDYMPTQAIGFVAARTHSKTDSKSSSFRFFETFDSYYFVSDEWLFKRGAINKVKEFTYSPFVNSDASDVNAQVKSLISFNNNRRADVASELLGGAYQNSVFEIDLLKHTAKRYNYKYLDGDKNTFTTSTGKKANSEIDIHSKEFIEDTFSAENAKRFMIIRDYREKANAGEFRDESYFRDIAARRMMYFQHMRATQVSASTRGRLDLQAGEVIKVLVKEMNVSGQSESNNQLSGRYLVTSITSIISEGVLTTGLTLFKYDWSDTNSDPEGVS